MKPSHGKTKSQDQQCCRCKGYVYYSTTNQNDVNESVKMESKIQATDRLRREGLWDQASLFRDEQRDKLRQEGVNRKDANQQAWELMLEEYPPKEIDDGYLEEEKFVIPVQKDVDWVQDVFWVYENIGNSSPDLPSSYGALAFLKWAKKYPERFFETVLPKAMSMMEKRTEGQKVFEDDGRHVFPHLDRIEREFAERNPQIY
ncbi:MAG: hypothetical protein GY818_11875 [Planctomycetaceae bacterium]|nr:hypothetical protein [Planctomycetaceae bacterium]